MDDLPFDYPDAQGPSLAGAVTERKHRHVWVTTIDAEGVPNGSRCAFCHVIKDEVRSRRGKQSRNYGNRAELKVARRYGGDKVGHAGGPVDVRGKDFQTQVKTHRRLPPLEWTKAFAAMAAARERCPRLLLRFVNGAGKPPADYFVFQADDFLQWFGKDE